MQGTFHWLRVQAFCYPTENEELVRETMTALVGNDGFECETSEGEHGNKMMIFQEELTKQKDFEGLFRMVGNDVATKVIADIDNRIDDDCVFYLRLDKQKAVKGEYVMAHHGDVISITGKVASHPARKEIATKNILDFLSSLGYQRPQQV
jgi:RNA-binding protein